MTYWINLDLLRFGLWILLDLIICFIIFLFNYIIKIDAYKIEIIISRKQNKKINNVVYFSINLILNDEIKKKIKNN
jgi:hypothetical protein